MQAPAADASVKSVNCTAPMFADDLALVAASGEMLQSLLDICSFKVKVPIQLLQIRFLMNLRSRPALRFCRSRFLFYFRSF